MSLNVARNFFFAVAASTSLACACSQGTSKDALPVAGATQEDLGTTVAEVSGKKITLGELDQHIAPQLKELEDHRFDMRRQGLDQLVNQQLVQAAAGKKGISEEQYLKEAVEAQIHEPSDKDIEDFFKKNSAQLPPGAKIADFKERIQTFLGRQARTEQAKTVFDNLRKEADVKILLKAPPKPRVKVDATGPSQGPDNAKVTIVEFSDFECPFCSRARDTVDQLMKKYDGKIRLVFRQFPLSFHQHAKKAAEAALCADAQKKFWPMHDALFADQKKLEPAALKETAEKLGLDKVLFAKCLDSGEKAAQVQADQQAGEKLGVTGTPAFFINGIMVAGALPLEEFERMVDEELKAD